MNRLLRLCGLVWLLVSLGGTVPAQSSGPKVSRIDITHVGPPAASDEIIRANIRIKAGDDFLPAKLDDDIRNLYGTGQFYNIRIRQDRAEDGGVVLIYVLQGKPRLMEVQFKGNKKLSNSKIRKKITSKAGDPLDERKLFTDSQAIQELYQKSGYPGTTVRAVPNVIEETGRGTAVFEITESEKIRIVDIKFEGAQAFKEKELRKQMKTKKRWMWSWLTGRGAFKDEPFQEDLEKLKEFYRDRGYIDFEIKDVQFENPTPRTMIIRFSLYEGRQYKVGAITFTGTTTLPTNAISPNYKSAPLAERGPDRNARVAAESLNRNFVMKQGDIFKSKDLAKDIEAVEDFYGIKGQIDVTASSGNLMVKRIANTETGTMDLEFLVNEGQVSLIEKIEIRGNVKTKDKVIRRELAVFPGEPFNMVGVKLSKRRLENMQYFEPGVDARAEPTSIPSRKDLVISLTEKRTGNFRVGAGFSSVDSVVGFAEVTQGNFDLFHPPSFTGAGQKFRLFAQLGTQRQDFEISFTEPWFLDRKLSLGVDLYHTEKSYLSLGNLYDENRTGARFSLTRALWSDFFVGSIGYTIEDVGIILDPSLHGLIRGPGAIPGGAGPGGTAPGDIPPNAPQAILNEAGHSLLTRLSGTIARDTRNSTFLPDGGQRTELTGEIVSTKLGGERDFYKLGLSSAWYFPGLFKGHVLEVAGRTGVAEGLSGDTVPFYERYYLGGAYSLRGFEYRSISPREPGFSEPVGGSTFWFASAEYSIPIFQKDKTGVRVAMFYDIGQVSERAFNFSVKEYSDNWGFGLRLELPIGPLRLDYGIPIHHDQYNSSSGRFQFTAGWTRPF